jgi:hypothetical protein
MMSTTRWALTGMTVCSLVLGVLVDSPLPAGAHGSVAGATGPAVQAKSPVGSYVIVSSNGGEGVITILPDNTFTSDYGDSGIWDSISASVGFLVTASTEGDDGCVFLGTFTKRRINSESRPGPQNCGSFSDTWFAIVPRNKTVSPRDVSSMAASGLRLRTAKNPTGKYQYTVPGEGSNPPLYIDPGGTTLLGDATGYWVSLGRALAFSETEGPSVQCISLGMFNKSGIGSAAKPAQTLCAGDSTVLYWYAPAAPS